MKASELIKELEILIIQFGDREVFAGGTDYPTGVSGVDFQERDDPYIPEGSFSIRQEHC